MNPLGEMVCLLGQGVEMRPTALYRRLRGNWNIEHKKFDYKGDNMDFRCLEIGNEAKSFLTDLEKKGLPEGESHLVLSPHTPEVLRLAGLDDLPIVLPKRKTMLGVFVEKGEEHGHKGEYSSIRLMKTLVQLGNPVAVLKDGDAVGVYVETLGNGGRPMFVCLKERKGANVVTSVYGDRRLKRDKDSVIYVDDTRLPNLWKGTKLKHTVRLRDTLSDMVYRGEVMVKSKISRKDIGELV